jgi:N-acetylglucosamine-6-phosphate deacetylase
MLPHLSKYNIMFDGMPNQPNYLGVQMHGPFFNVSASGAERRHFDAAPDPARAQCSQNDAAPAPTTFPWLRRLRLLAALTQVAACNAGF